MVKPTAMPMAPVAAHRARRIIPQFWGTGINVV
jgi:hypothetical protein